MKYKRLEFCAALVLFALYIYTALVFGFSSSGYNPGAGLTGFRYFLNHHLPNLLLVLATYGAFLIINYYIVPKYWPQKKLMQAFGLTALVWVVMGLIFMVAQSYLRDWEYQTQPSLFKANISLFSRGFSQANLSILIYAVYTSLRELIIHLYQQWEVKQKLRAHIVREAFLLFITIPITLLVIKLLYTIVIAHFFGPTSVVFFYLLLFISLPYCIIVYLLNLYWLIPSYRRDSGKNGLKYFFKLTATVILAGVIEMAFQLQTNEFSFLGHLVFNWFLPTVITIGISWWVYLLNAEKFAQLNSLQTALVTSNANLQYLRSQINPHFLFNALNTLYGTALMEKAEKTGEGIQKLGDMMRFMLHENNQDKIPLGREIDYLHNYIALQNMRLALSPDLVIDIQIEDITGYYEIAPMLLIPFIENAYKHGISLQEKSWINVNLFQKDNTLHLDVHNSIHPVKENNPERYQSGTGLDNVKQRLQLLYPGQHELVIRQNIKEFFIHLSITLNTHQNNQ